LPGERVTAVTARASRSPKAAILAAESASFGRLNVEAVSGWSYVVSSQSGDEEPIERPFTPELITND
jgi:hypothetical protein